MIALDPHPRPIDTVPLRGRGDVIAFGAGVEALTFADLERAVGALAAWLAGQELKPGDRVASWLPKTRAAALLPLAAPRAGLVHVPINPVLKRAQVAHILADSGAALLMTQPERARTLDSDDLPARCTIASEHEIDWERTALPPSDAPVDSLAAILYTSGSTGRAKGVMLSHANLWLGAMSVAHYLAIGPGDRTLAVLPFAFDYGQNQLLAAWIAGGAVIPLDYAVPRDVPAAVARHAITTLAGVPPLWHQLLQTDWPTDALSNLKRITNSGGALTRSMVAQLRARFPKVEINAMYGLTEAFRSTALDPRLIDAHPDSIGRAVPFAEVLVVRGDGRRAAAGEPGELVHAGPLVAHGYWRDPARTAARFRPVPDYAVHDGMAVWSGDTVIEGADGLLRFVGRTDEMIKSAGNRISPTEIEEMVLAGGEAVEAAAFGVPDPVLGQHIVVVARAAGEPKSAEAALRTRLRRELPSFMQPARYCWRATMPIGPNGKLDRAALRRAVTS